MIDEVVSEGCATLEVDHFARLSAHDSYFARDLCGRVQDLSDRDDVKAIVLRTRGPDFSPAAPPPAHQRVSDVLTTWHQSFAAATAIYQSMCFSKKVVITEVTGECSGAGSMLVLCSDLTVASKNARFTSPFNDYPEANFVLAALTIRLNRAKSWLLTGASIVASDALQFGLVNEVVPTERVAETTKEMVDQVRAMPLDGITMSKMLLQAVLDAHGVGREFDMADHYAIHRLGLHGESARSD